MDLTKKELEWVYWGLQAQRAYRCTPSIPYGVVLWEPWKEAFLNKVIYEQSTMSCTNMRTKLINALKAHANGEIQKHLANVEVYLSNPAGIGEHSDITEAIGVELDKIARYHDQVEVLNNYVVKKDAT